MKRYTESSLFRPLDRGAGVKKMRKGVANNSELGGKAGPRVLVPVFIEYDFLAYIW